MLPFVGVSIIAESMVSEQLRLLSSASVVFNASVPPVIVVVVAGVEEHWTEAAVTVPLIVAVLVPPVAKRAVLPEVHVVGAVVPGLPLVAQAAVVPVSHVAEPDVSPFALLISQYWLAA
jgi:hypothetical protein